MTYCGSGGIQLARGRGQLACLTWAGSDVAGGSSGLPAAVSGRRRRSQIQERERVCRRVVIEIIWGTLNTILARALLGAMVPNIDLPQTSGFPLGLLPRSGECRNLGPEEVDAGPGGR